MFIILQIFYATRAVLKIGLYSRISPSFSWGIFGHVTCLHQSRAKRFDGLERVLYTNALFFEHLPYTTNHPYVFFFRQEENDPALQGEKCVSQNSASDY